jgi:MFS family permease
VWTTKSIIGNAVAFSFAGVALGPMYPIVMVVVMDIIPAELQSGAIGIIASIGQVGSAILPFVTGGIAQAHGVWILQPLMVALMGLSLGLWFFVPRKPVKA